ncbi:MAG: hypothetical protein HGA38_00120 [Candidatus Moranbacteria bacterium]|nr:hypothetical protein [Candidatus Moranbacteria bacterium]NTW45945.1 hypothetical protein [Candidatus Moranbacteria bacterium]
MKESLIKIENLLKKAGFLDKEVAVYLTLLEMGRGVVSEIARRANVNRTTGYVILDSLTGKGLVSVSGKKPKQEYMAESPENLVKYLYSEIESRKAITRQLDGLLPEMTSLYRKGDRPKVYFYEGEEGLKRVYEDTLTATGPIVAYATYEDMHKALPGYFPDYYKRRAKKGIFARGIVPETPLAYERVREDKNEARELALVPADRYTFSPDIEIYDNKIMIASWREKLGIIIESGEIADAMKKIFELAWIAAKGMDRN